MIRTTRTYDAKPGKLPELLEVLNDIKSYLVSQGVEVQIFTEPWGIGGRVHQHGDYEDAATAQVWLDDVRSHQRGQDDVDRRDTLIEGHMMASFLFEEE